MQEGTKEPRSRMCEVVLNGQVCCAQFVIKRQGYTRSFSWFLEVTASEIFRQ